MSPATGYQNDLISLRQGLFIARHVRIQKKPMRPVRDGTGFRRDQLPWEFNYLP
jgi:hypothetical protein